MKHARKLRDLVSVIQHAKNDLGRNIVREVTGDPERFFPEVVFQGCFEEVSLHNGDRGFLFQALQLGGLEMFSQISDGILIHIHGPQFKRSFEQVSGENTGSGTDFKNFGVAFKTEGLRNFIGNVLVLQKMLPQMLFGLYLSFSP